MIKIKNEYFNFSKIIGISFTTSKKNGLSYLVLSLDVLNENNNKAFIEVQDQSEFDQLIIEVFNQLGK